MQRHFYATKEDLLPVFERVERKYQLAYTLTGLLTTRVLTTVCKGSAIATLGSPAPYPSAIAGYCYLVTPVGEPVSVQDAPQNAGGVRYEVSQLGNPKSISILHGGIYPPNVLLYGRVDTVSDDPFAAQLYRAFASSVAKHFKRVRACYVGPHASKLWQSGYRLAIGADSPTDYDLAYEDPAPKSDR